MLRKYFITGLLILVPLSITLWVVRSVIGLMDQSILLLPIEWRPESLVGHHIPGLGTILTLLTIVVTGLLAQNFIGSYILGRWEALLKRIPIVNSIYSSVKQVSDTLFSSDGNAFRTAVLVQYPRPGAWTIAFVTGTPSNAVRQHLEGDFVSIYVPTTPNPTSGFFIMVPRTDIIELTMTVDVALKHIVSMGVVAPELHP
ncbi:MAG: hypothetical protein K0R08_554 [Solimicrobium sp.]|nr:hypothetical protein [Solimicrobium sp.]